MAGVADKNALKAGLFIVFSIVLAITVLWTVQGYSLSGGQGWTVRFELTEDVGGLTVGNEVRIGGVQKGQVQNVELGDNLDHVVVSISLPEDVTLRQGSKVQVQSTVTGVSWLNFESLGQGEPLDPDEPLDGEGGNLTIAVESVAELAPTLSGLATDLRESLVPQAGEVLERMKQTAQTITDTAAKAGGTVDRVDSLLADNRAALDQTINNFRSASERVPKLLDDTSALVEQADGAIEQLSVNVQDSADRLDNLLASAQQVANDAKAGAEDTRITLREVRGLIQGNRGKIEQIIDRMTSASSQLSLAASEIRRSPWRLLYKPDGQQRESLDLYDAARRFAEGANAVQDAAIALEDATADPTADTARVQELLDRLRTRFDEYEKVEQEFFQKLD